MLSAGVEVAALEEAAPPQPTSRLAAIPAANRADTCFFIVFLLLLPFGIYERSLSSASLVMSLF